MPELPEVEVTCRRIAPLFEGRQLAEVLTGPDSYFFLTPPKELKRRLRGRRAERLIRHGKYILLALDDQSRVMLHLGMTGQLFAEGAPSVRLLSSTSRGVGSVERGGQARPFDQHTHLVFQFEDAGLPILFRDVRKFGKVLWIPRGESDPRLDKLGVDALAAEPEAIFGLARRRSAAIKSVLLDQALLAGVGNIYADEALFYANINPQRKASALSAEDWARLLAAVKRVMLRSIETGGSSISDYVQPDGKDGAYQDERRVYAREGLPCLSCGSAISRVVLGQRSSHFCPRCQAR